TTSQLEATRFYSPLGLDIDGESIDRSSSPTSLTNIRSNFRHGQKKKELRSVGLPTLTNASFLFSSVYNKWERQDSNLRRKTSTDLQSAAFDHSATLPFPGRGPLNGF